MADESFEDILAKIQAIGNDSEDTEETPSEMETLGKNTADYIDSINSYEEFDNVLNALAVEDTAIEPEDETVSVVGALARGARDAVVNNIKYPFTGTSGLVTPGTRAKQLAGEEWGEWKQIAYSVGHEAAHLGQNLLAAAKLGGVGAAGGAAASGPVAPVGATIGGIAGAGTGYATSALYNSIVMGAEVWKDAYNDALNRGYKESDAKWEAFEKSGATFALEYLSQYIPIGAAGKVASKVVPDLVKNGIVKVENGIVKVLDKAAFRKVAAGATAKEAVKETAEGAAESVTKGAVAKSAVKEGTKAALLKRVAKEGAKGAGEESGEETFEDILHQAVEIYNDPNKTLADFSTESVIQSAKGGAVGGGILRNAAPVMQKGIEVGIKEPVERYKYGKKVSEEITNVDDKTITIDAREKTIEDTKRKLEYETAADKQSVAQTNLENKIVDTEGNSVNYTDIKEDEQYIVTNKDGVEQTMSGKEAKQAWRKEYNKNKEIHKKDIIAKLAGNDSFKDLFSVKNSKGENVTDNEEFNADEEYTVTFAGKSDKVLGSDIQKLRSRYLEEAISTARNELGIGHLNKTSDKPVISQAMADVITRRRQQLNNIKEFYDTHQVIDLETNEAVNPNEVRPEGRYKVIQNDGTVVNEDTSGLGVSILEKYAPSKHPGWSPINISEAEAELIKRGNATVNGKYLNLSRKANGDLVDQYTVHEQIGESGYLNTDWGAVSKDDDRLFTIKNRNGDIVVKDYTGEQINTFVDLVTRNASMEDADFLSEHTIQTMEGNDVDWNSLDDTDTNTNTRYKILHNGNVIGENISSSGASLYKRLATRQFIKTDNGQTYIYIKASSQYDGAPGTLFVRANDPTNTTYIGDNTDLMGDTNFEFERDILSAKQRQQTRLAILKAIKAQKNTEQNTDEAVNLDESPKEFIKKDSDDEALERQSEFSGGANPESFGQVLEFEWADDFIFSKPDTAPATREEIAYTIEKDVKDLVDSYKGDIQKLVKGDKTIPIGKEHLRSILSKLAKNLGYKMLNELGEKGILGKHVSESTMGSIAAKYKYFRIRNSRDYRSGLHELGHGIYRDGIWGSGKDQLKTATDGQVFLDEMEELFSNKVQANSEINLSAYNDKDNPYAIAEEQFCEAVMVLATDPRMTETFKQYAPKTFAALDAYLTQTNSWADVKQMQIAAKYYVEQSPLQRAIANLTMPNRSVFSQVFSPTWWKNLCFKKIAVDVMSHTTDDMAGIRYMAERLGVAEGSDEVEFLRSIGNDSARRLIAGDGCNFAGQSLKGYNFKNLKEVLGPIYEKFGKAGINKLESLLWAQATLGENIGNERVLAKLRKLSAKQQHGFIDSFQAMRRISNKFWDEFIKPEDTQAGDVTDLPELKLSAQEVADMINSYKKAARELLTTKDLSDAQLVPELKKELEAIKKENDPVERDRRRKVWQETVIKEALKQNFKQKLKEDIADTGMSIVDAMTIYDDVLVNDDNASLYAQAAEDYHDYQKALLLHISGASSEMKFYAERIMNNASGWHAPLLRQFSEDEEAVSPNYLLATREGSDRAVSDLYENTIKQTVSLCNIAAKSAIKEFLVNLVDNTGSGLYIRELTEPSNQITVKIQDIKEAVFRERDKKLQELKDRGVAPTSAITDAVNDVMNEAANLNITTLSLFATTTKVDKDHCQFCYFDPAENRMRFFETEGSVYQALEKPNGASGKAMKAMGAILRWGMIGMKLNLITINPAFLLLTNPVRDTFTLAWKGDTPLIRTGNRFLDTNPMNTIPGAIYYVAQTYLDFILNKGNPDIFKLMDQFGVGYNTRNNSYKNFQKMVQNDSKVRYLSSNPLKAALQIGESVVDSLGNLDKLARTAQLKAMLKKDGLSPDNFNVSRRNVAAMVLDKQVLLANGITQDIIDTYLTPEQRTIWENTKADEAPVLDLTVEQANKIYMAVRPENVHEFTKAQRIRYAKALRLCTTDFARGGDLLRRLNKVFLFAQPAFNGTAQSVERIKMRIATGHGDEVLANILTTFAAGLAYQYLIPDDEDEAEDEMWRGIKIPIGNTTWRAPVLAEDMWWFQLARYLMKDSPKDYQKFTMSFFRNINPFGSLSGPGALSVSMITGTRSNDLSDSRWGKPIVPDYMKKTMGTKHPELFYNESTSALARLAGRFVSNPMQIQYFMDQTGLSIWDNIVENLLGVRRATRTQGGLDINNPSRRWTDLQNMVGINTHPYQTRSQQAIENMFDEAKGEYYAKVPPSKRKRPIGLTREQMQLRQNYLALNQVEQTIGIFNKLESIALDPNDREAIKKQKTAYMQQIVKKMEKVPGLEGKYYYQLSMLRKQKQRLLDWKERALTIEARKEAQKPSTLSSIANALFGVSDVQADEPRPGERPTQILDYNAATQFPVTAEKESGGKMWSTKTESKKVRGYEVGGFGMYQLDPWATGGHDKMRNYIETSRFNTELAKAFDNTSPYGIDYKKLAVIWEDLAKNPQTATAFSRDYEDFMIKEYLPTSLLNKFKAAGYDINNPNVRDAIFSYSIQRPASVKAFANSLPKAIENSVSPSAAISAIMESKRNNPYLKRYSSRYDEEEQMLLEKERNRR